LRQAYVDTAAELDCRVLAALEQELMRDDVRHAFQEAYAAELVRLAQESNTLRPEDEFELARSPHSLAISGRRFSKAWPRPSLLSK
jgi:hypothetical protein